MRFEGDDGYPVAQAGKWRYRACAIVILALLSALAMPAVSFAGTEAGGKDAAEPSMRMEGGQLHCYQDGVSVKSSWKTVRGRTYYLDSSGSAVRGRAKKVRGTYYVFANNGALLEGDGKRVVKLKGGIYYVGEDGCPAASGWALCSGKLRWVHRSGRCAVGRTKEGIALKANGVARKSVASKLKIAIMRHVAKVTKPEWSRKRKLRACWLYGYRILQHRFVADSSTKPGRSYGSAQWLQESALVILERGEGCCFNQAAYFAACAKELGYDPVVRSINNYHACVSIGKKAYDNGRYRMSEEYGVRIRPMRHESTWRMASWGRTKALRRRS